ncbi:TPA: hypothetical protein GDO54_018470 [Pyxicephalus adspersus]|uniref:Uncharacterized protein n=1 Tax=Pyxicephalus adspersus TaxID=30357 RepID=A0AAV2ZNY0_PYXAD|nr:TPA: hypothetical protein GDO54_018470 [Pyxicephalus adspersus]
MKQYLSLCSLYHHPSTSVFLGQHCLCLASVLEQYYSITMSNKVGQNPIFRHTPNYLESFQDFFLQQLYTCNLKKKKQFKTMNLCGVALKEMLRLFI